MSHNKNPRMLRGVFLCVVFYSIPSGVCDVSHVVVLQT